MFDLTKEIQLESGARKKYITARILLYLLFLVAVFFTAYKILFPSSFLVFSFSNINSLKNTLVSPRIDQTGAIIKGSLPSNTALAFNANPLGNFSDANVTFTLDKSAKNIVGTSVNIRKSYQAFFFPVGDPVGFRDGTLLTENGNYYIVSAGALRKFSTTGIITQLGYAKSAFLPISPSDLQYNKIGADIIDANVYPDDTFFAIGDTYYQFKNQQLFPFVSTRAFLSQFDAIAAIIKTEDFLSRYQISESPLGFIDGTLASYDQSVFILSEGKSYPIESADTFAQMGFDWNNVIPVDSGELGAYQRQKQFTHDQPHPDGTLFLDQVAKTYFVIANSQKHPIKSAAIVQTYSKQNPVLADSQQSQISAECQLKSNFSILNPNTYSCNIPLGSLTSFIGNDYQFGTTFANDIKIKNIDTTFFTPLTWQNFRMSLSLIKFRLKNNYTQPSQ